MKIGAELPHVALVGSIGFGTSADDKVELADNVNSIPSNPGTDNSPANGIGPAAAVPGRKIAHRTNIRTSRETMNPPKYARSTARHTPGARSLSIHIQALFT